MILPLFSSIWNFHPLKEQLISIQLSEMEQNIFNEMSRLYCSDAEAVRLKKEALQTIYNREMRRIGLKLLKLPDTMIDVWLEANVVKKIIDVILPLLYITVGNQ